MKRKDKKKEVKKKKKTESQKDRTLLEQEEVQNSCLIIYQTIFNINLEEEKEYFEDFLPGVLNKDNIAAFVYKKLLDLGSDGFFYDNGHPWLIYWSIHALILLDHPIYNIKPLKIRSELTHFLSYCQDPKGGFCGGHHQLPHLASTYAAVLSIIEIGTLEAYQLIDRRGMFNFLMSLRSSKRGSFLMHENGEEDMRGVYIATIICDILNIDKEIVLDGVPEYIGECQTFEGGIASEPYGEAHGGYSFCGFAALCCLNNFNHINIGKLMFWAANRQMTLEGGFNGRTNKVVDNCYSFWQGALFKLFNIATGDKCCFEDKMLFNQLHLQQYCLICGQDFDEGGLIDKPGKNPDLYHTAYALSGLSIAQRLIGNDNKFHYMKRNENLLKETDPIFNVECERLKNAREFFQKLNKISSL